MLCSEEYTFYDFTRTRKRREPRPAATHPRSNLIQRLKIFNSQKRNRLWYLPGAGAGGTWRAIPLSPVPRCAAAWEVVVV
jgi:hypothetical protein